MCFTHIWWGKDLLRTLWWSFNKQWCSLHQHFAEVPRHCWMAAEGHWAWTKSTSQLPDCLLGESRGGGLERYWPGVVLTLPSVFTSFCCHQEVLVLCQLKFANRVYAMFNRKSEGVLQKQQIFAMVACFIYWGYPVTEYSGITFTAIWTRVNLD